MDTKIIPADAPDAIVEALQALQAGCLVAFPTDTVYGVASLAFDVSGIARLFEVKDREWSKAVPILLNSATHLDAITARVSPAAMRLAESFWPGPLTLVVARNPALPDILAPDATVGVRVPDHPVALALLRAAGPLAVTSANLSGGPNTRTAGEVYDQLGGQVAIILDGGETPGGQPSTVVDCTGNQPVILRQGPILLSQIEAAVMEI